MDVMMEEMVYGNLSKLKFFKAMRNLRWLWSNLLWFALIIVALFVLERIYLHLKVVRAQKKLD